MTQFIDHLYTQLVTTSNSNSLTDLHTLKITVTAKYIFFYIFTSRFLVTDLNNVLCLRPYRVANTPQLNSSILCRLSTNCLGYNISARTA
jgi:hypothetical protein